MQPAEKFFVIWLLDENSYDKILTKMAARHSHDHI